MACWQQGLRPAAVVAIGRVHHDAPDTPARIAEYLALAAVDAFVRIQAPLLAQAWGQFDTLRVHQRQRRRGQTPLRQPVGAVTGLTQAFKRAIRSPPGEVIVNG
nr:hypothetical protein [Hymenobacter telluris]